MEPLTADDPRQVGVYRLQSRLGAGGMGRVYLGASPGGRAVAVKVVHPELARDPEFMRRFRHETQAAEAVSGAYTAPVVGAGPDDDPPWLATAYVPGPSLAELIAGSGPLPEAAVWRLAGGLIEALQAIHGRGLVHRDLKPGNVLIAADGPRVIDFGISRALDGTALTATRTTMGTPAYMSPEQAEGGQIGPASDVFSLGSVLAFAATGFTPFGGGEPLAVIYRIAGGEPDLSRLPPALRALVAWCLAKDPGGRPSLAALMRDVTAGSASFPATAPGEFWPEPVTAMAAFAAGALPGTTNAGRAPSAPVAPVARPATVVSAGPARSGITTPPSPAPGPGAEPRRRSLGRWPLIGAAALVAAAAGAGLALKLAPGTPGTPGSPSGENRLAAKTSAPAAAPSRPASATASATASPSAASPSAATSPTASLTATVCIYPAGGCAGAGGSRYMEASPLQIVDSGDGSGYVKNLVWSGWGGQQATATGVQEVDDCDPDCAQGSYAGYAATVTVAGLKPYAADLEGYSTIVIQAPGADTTSTYTTGTVP